MAVPNPENCHKDDYRVCSAKKEKLEIAVKTVFKIMVFNNTLMEAFKILLLAQSPKVEEETFFRIFLLRMLTALIILASFLLFLKPFNMSTMMGKNVKDYEKERIVFLRN